MAMDRETIVSLHKKNESNSTIAKELQIRRETDWKVVKKFRETGQTSNRPGQSRKRTVQTKQMVKKPGGNVEDKSPSFNNQTGSRGWNQPDFNEPHPSGGPQDLPLQDAEAP